MMDRVEHFLRQMIGEMAIQIAKLQAELEATRAQLIKAMPQLQSNGKSEDIQP